MQACFSLMFDGYGSQCGEFVQTIEMILGETPAPWEDPQTGRALLRPLGIFKTGVLGLLARDPAQRSTVHKFQQACMRSLANTSITAT